MDWQSGRSLLPLRGSNGRHLTATQYAITGAAHGMALVIAQQLSKRGATISLADVNEEGLEHAVKTLEGDKHITTVVDVRKSKSVDEWIDRTVKTFGRLDGAVNFAGICIFKNTLSQETDDIWQRTMDINASGVFYCLRAQLRHMKKGASIVSHRSCLISWPNFSSFLRSMRPASTATLDGHSSVLTVPASMQSSD